MLLTRRDFGKTASARSLAHLAIGGGAALACLLALLMSIVGGDRIETTPLVARKSAFGLELARTSRSLSLRLTSRDAAWQRWVKSPKAGEQRVASRTAFHGLTTDGARRLLVDDYDSLLVGATANPAASVSRSGRILRYLNNYEAVVNTTSGLELKTSTAPLLTKNNDGALRPVDLKLAISHGQFVPRNALSAVSIARDSVGGVSLGHRNLAVAMVGANVSGSSINDQSVFFPNVAEDTDSVAAPTLSGAELFTMLRSRLSPEEIRYRLSLPAGATLSVNAGGALISRSGLELARVPAPSARDAQGVEVPVQMSVAHHELILSIDHRKRDVAYPVIVDPNFITITNSASGWTFMETEGLGNFVGSSPGGGGELGVTGPEVTYPVLREGKYYYEAGGRWTFTPPPSPEFIAAEFQHVSFSASAISAKGEAIQAVHWELSACGRGAGGTVYLSPPPEPIITFYGERHAERNCEYPIGFSLHDAGGKVEKDTESGALTVAAIVLTARYNIPPSESYGSGNPAAPGKPTCIVGKPVNCVNGNETESQTDFTVGGRGPGLSMTRTYNSQLAESEHEPGLFGYGWTGPYSTHIVIEKPCGTCEIATVYQENGSTVLFEYINEKWVPTAPLVEATLKDEGSGYVYTLANQTQLKFESSGRLTSETDRNGNSLTMNRNSEGRLESVSDPAARKLTFTYNLAGEVESSTDPMGHIVKYTYESGNLVGVTRPSESSLRWKFKYNSSHELTEITDGRGNTITTEYNGSHQVISQTDPLSRKRTWKYGTLTEGTYTEITEPNGAVTREEFNLQGLPVVVTHAYGTLLASKTTYEYDGYDNLTSVTDANKHTTTYTYNATNDRLSEKDPNGNEMKWAYDSIHDVTATTTPKGETTTIKRDGHGNAETIERPAPGGKTQKTLYKYDTHGNLTGITDPLERTTKYEYDSYGDRTAEINPEGDKRTWGYNEDSQATSTTSPRGNVSEGESTGFTTTIERDPEGSPISVTEPEPLASGKPSNTTPATISGVAQEGLTLTAGVGIWRGAPSLTYSFQWEKCNSAGESCTNISGATGGTHSPTNSEVGDTLRAIVTATNSTGSSSSTSEATKVVLASPAYAQQFGSKGTENGQFGSPFGVAIDANGDVWVADPGNQRFQEFSASGAFMGAYGSKGTGAGQFGNLGNIVINHATGDIYISDRNNNRIQEFTSAGAFIRTFGFGVSDGESKPEICLSGCRAGIAGSAHGQLDQPVGIAVDTSGDVWVVNNVSDVIEEFTASGEYLTQFGKSGSGHVQFSFPEGVAVAGEDVYVSDYGNNRIEEISSSGTYIREWGHAGTGNGEFALLRNIVIEELTGDVYVADTGNFRVQEFSPSGVFLGAFGTHGTGEGQNQGIVDMAFGGGGAIYTVDEFTQHVEIWEAIPSAPVFVSNLGLYGSENGEFSSPVDISLDAAGGQWVTDSHNNRVEKFSSTGTFVASYGSYGTGATQFNNPTGVVVNQSTGDVYVADQANERIKELSPEGTFISAFGFGVTNGKEEAEVCTSSCRAGNVGSGEGQFNKPDGLTIDSVGNVWIVDQNNSRIEKFSSSGLFIASYGSHGSGTGQFASPSGITYANGNIYVTDSGNNRVEEFSTAGAFIRQFGESGIGAAQFRHPVGIKEGLLGTLYVADTENNRVEEFTTAGTYLGTFGIKGASDGQFEGPEGIGFGNAGTIYVVDTGNNRIDRWRIAGVPSNLRSPMIFGQLLSGQELSASTGMWSAAPSPTYSYQWKRCNTSGEGCINISGATKATYTPSHSDVRHTLRVSVTASNTHGSAEAESIATEVVAPVRVTEYSYDADGNLEGITDAAGGKAKYTYDDDNELTKIEEPNGAIMETAYDNAGRVISQADGNKHTTKYVRNALENVTEVVDPLGKKTIKEYDSVGDLTRLTDAKENATTYTYDPADRPTGIKYSDGKTAAVKFEYDKDGDRTAMSDGSGTTTYTYDQLDRLTALKDGHGDATNYEYDLADEQTMITYPNGKKIVRVYNSAGRLEKVTDWLEHTIKFMYDPDGDLTATIFPTGTTNEDKYAYNVADEMTEAKMLKGTETLASLLYTREIEGQIKTTASKGLPGAENSESTYDANGRLSKVDSAAYEYDAANNPTRLAANTYKYNSASQLETGPSLSYTYDELGERIKTTPTSGPATTYGYNEAENIISVARAKEGEIPQIEDTYGYDGDGLRISEDISGATKYLAWDPTESLPLALSDGTNSYVYGPGQVAVEQINNTTGTVQYLHHDQAGSTRLVTGATGSVEGKCSYGPYGAPTCEGSTTPRLGYDGQLTSSDTGLIDLRARDYDPATAQFLSRDPLAAISREPYSYAEDNPLNESDPTGEDIFGAIGKALFPGGGSKQLCAGGAVSVGSVTLGGEVCYVQTPHGQGITMTPSVTVGPGFGLNVHAGAGESNACRSSEYGGPFSQMSGSASFGFSGGYDTRFTSFPFSEVKRARRVEGWTTGGAAGMNAEVGVGGSYTWAIPFGSESSGSESSGCGC